MYDFVLLILFCRFYIFYFFILFIWLYHLHCIHCLFYLYSSIFLRHLLFLHFTIILSKMPFQVPICHKVAWRYGQITLPGGHSLCFCAICPLIATGPLFRKFSHFEIQIYGPSIISSLILLYLISCAICACMFLGNIS